MLFRALATAVLALSAGTAFAQTVMPSFAGKPIADVRMAIEGRPTTEPALVDLVETQPGRPLSLPDVRETITHLYSLGRFQDVRVEATEAPNGAVSLLYSLVPVHAVERVEFAGVLGLSASLLRDTVDDRFGRAPQIGRAAEVIRTLERLYEDRGYFNASIRAESVELHDPDRTILTFEIAAGPQARIRNIEISGDPRTTREDLLARLGVAPGDAYERVRLQQRLTDYADRLKKRGHLQASASHSPRISDDGTAADLTLDVQAGPLVNVTFAGDPLPTARRDELAPFRREGSVDEDLLEDSAQRLREYLRQQGFWKADVTFDPRESEGKLDIVFTVRKGPVYRVAAEGVEVAGNKAVRIEELRPLIVPKPGEPYVSSHLDATVGAIVLLYRTRGFAWVDVKTAENEVPSQGGYGTAVVRPAIAITEGPRAVVGNITVAGAAALREEEIRRAANLQSGTAYYEPTIRSARDAVQLEYLNLGFASAQVTIGQAVSEDRSRVDLTISIAEGLQTLVDHVIVVGNQRTSDDVIRREVVLRPGAPLGLRDLLESRRRLSQLGLFRRFDIRELEHGPASRRDVLVTVEEAPATTLGYGGGLELNRRLRAGGASGEAEERIELAPRGFFDIGRRNLGGKNRSVNLFMRVSLRPRDAPDDPTADGRGFGFSEYRVVGTYREPRAFHWNADWTVTGAFEQGVRSSFNFTRKGVTGELVRRLTPTIRTSVRYSLGTTRTFDERLQEDEQSRIDRLFPQVRLSIFSTAIARDTRDDVVEPTRGAFLSGETSMATRGLGGQVGFLKTYLQGYWFKRLFASGVVFATRASAGLADGFPREAQPVDDQGRPIEGPPEIIEDLPASERFFAGGDTTIRGFALDTVGVPKTISQRGFPRGGNGVLILNAELRVPVWKEIGAAFFVDGGNVWERVTDFDVSELRGSVGFGLRYRSPIGPVRIDLGFKMDRRDVAGKLEDRSVLHFAIGQAF